MYPSTYSTVSSSGIRVFLSALSALDLQQSPARCVLSSHAGLTPVLFHSSAPRTVLSALLPAAAAAMILLQPP